MSAASLLANNRAGPNERHLTVEEIVRHYRKGVMETAILLHLQPVQVGS